MSGPQDSTTAAAGRAPSWDESYHKGSFGQDSSASLAALNTGDGGGGTSNLERLIRLFTNEDTAEIAERQLVVLRQVCKVRQRGFRYGELPLVERLLPLVESRVTLGHQASEFRDFLLKLLDICSLAPVRDRANQEFTERGLTAASSLFHVLGGLLWSPDAGIQSATAVALKKIAAGNDPTRPNTPDDENNHRFGECRDDLRPKPKDINQALLLGCGVVTSAVACLGAVIGGVSASLAELDEDSSLDSSSFDGGDDAGAVDGFVQSASGLEATDLPQAGSDHDLDNAERADEDNDDDDEVDSTATKAHDELELENAEIGGGGRSGKSSSLALKYVVLSSLLQLVRELSTDANSSAAMVEEGIAALLVQVIRTIRGIRDPTLSITVEVMWNCLEHSQNAMDSGLAAKSRTSLVRKARKSNAAFALSSWNGVSALRDTVETLLIGGFRNKDKELRNEAVIVASQLLTNGRSHPLFRSTGMLLLLLRYATAIETGLADGNPAAVELEARTFSVACTDGGGSSGGSGAGVPQLGPLADPRNFATPKEVDMELKLLLWSLLTDLCKRDARNVEVVDASPLMETLLMYMDLVVEEGQSGDALPPGMSRSISLASLPPLGSGHQMNSPTTTVGPSSSPRSSVGGTGGFKRNSSGAAGSEVGGDKRPSAAPPSGSAPISGDHHPLANGTGAGVRSSEGSTTSAEHNGTGDAAPQQSPKKRQASSGSGGLGIGGVAQLFVPASVFRLPMTLIQLLQRQAMASLLVLAPKCPAKFQALGGHMVTLRLLDRLGSRPDNQRLVRVATKMLATVVSLPGLKEELGRVDGVRIMLDRFSDEWKREQQGGGGGTGGSSVGVGGGSVCSSGGGGGGGGGEGAGDVRTDMVIILCRLCEECPENQEAFRKADGVPIMMAAVKAYCRARSEVKQKEGANSSSRGGGGGGGSENGGGSSVGGGCSAGGMESGGGGSGGEGLDPSLVHIIDCVWCAVVGNRRSEARLLQCEGLDTLLDLLELCPAFMRHQVTGIIADLLRNKRSIPYARAWRSDLNMLSVTQLMVRLWVAEECRLGVSRPNGVLQNLWEPLKSHDRGRGRRSLRKTPARRVRSRPTTGEEVANGSSTSLTSDGGTATADALLSRTTAESSNAAQVVSLNQTSSSGNPQGGVLLDDEVIPNQSTTEEAGDVLALAGGGDGGVHEEASRRHSYAVALALEAGKRAVAMEQGGGGGGGSQRKRGALIDAEASVAKAMTHLDLRGKIAAVLGMVACNGNTTDGLDPGDLKASYMATSFLAFRAGEVWQGVAAELDAQGINPIAADALVLDTMLERAFDCAREVKSKQMALTVEQRERDGETEEAFLAGIIFQRDQASLNHPLAIIKRNALIPSATKKRLTAKKSKAGMLRSQGGSSDMITTGSDEGVPEDDSVNKEPDTAVQIKGPMEAGPGSTLLAAAG
ncbi:unnamed protein product [Ectocarpus fasciculatus]